MRSRGHELGGDVAECPGWRVNASTPDDAEHRARSGSSALALCRARPESVHTQRGATAPRWSLLLQPTLGCADEELNEAARRDVHQGLAIRSRTNRDGVRPGRHHLRHRIPIADLPYRIAIDEDRPLDPLSRPAPAAPDDDPGISVTDHSIHYPRKPSPTPSVGPNGRHARPRARRLTSAVHGNAVMWRALRISSFFSL